MKFSLTDSVRSTLLLNKLSNLGGIQENKKYYISNHNLNQWLAWKEVPWKKIKYALISGYEDYIFWNNSFFNTKRYEHIEKACIYWACKGGNINLIKKLMQDAKLRSFENDWFSIACKKGYTEIVKYMLPLLDNYSAAMDLGMDNACLFGHFELVQLLIEYRCIIVSDYFVSACAGGNLDIVKLTIDKDYTDDWNIGMYSAAEAGHKNVFEFILDKAGGWTNAHISQSVNSFYYISTKNGHYEISVQISHLVSRECLFFAACTEGNLEKVSNNNTDLDYFDIYLLLGMVIACEKGYLDIVKYILEKTQWYHYNDTVAAGLLDACKTGQLEIIKYLVQYDHSYQDPFLMACTNGYMDIVQFMLSKHSIDRIQLVNGFGAACKGNNLELVQLLFKLLVDSGVFNSELFPLIDSKIEQALETISTEIFYYLIIQPNINIGFEWFFAKLKKNRRVGEILMLIDMYDRLLPFSINCDEISKHY